MPKQPKFLHDLGYKELLSCNQLFLELLDSFVDQSWVKEIDRDNIIRIDKSFIDEKYLKKEADLVYQLQLNGRKIIFYLLMELQSTNDFLMPYRLLQYMVGIWRYYLKNQSKAAKRKNFRLPMIVPLVVYNGAGNWTACHSFKETLSQTDWFGEYVVNFKYILIDVNRYNETDLWELANLIDGVFLLDQNVEPEVYHQRLINMAPVLKKYGKPMLDLFLNWFVTVACKELSKDTKIEILQELKNINPEEAEQVVSNMSHTWKKMYNNAKMEGLLAGESKCKIEGKIEGEKKAAIKHAQLMLVENIDESIIAKITGLPVVKIRNLRKNVNSYIE
jgi:predicted transposase/invertase (TIGR01784 family)